MIVNNDINGNSVLHVYDIDTLEKCDSAAFKNSRELFIYNCEITSLKGCPSYVKNGISIVNCDKLVSLEGAPEVSMAISVRGCNLLSSLTGIKSMDVDSVILDSCKTLKDITERPDSYNLIILKCPIDSLVGISNGKIKKFSLINLNSRNSGTVKRGGLGLVSIENVEISNNIFFEHTVYDIISKYINLSNKSHALIECQSELIENNLDDYAIL